MSREILAPRPSPIRPRELAKAEVDPGPRPVALDDEFVGPPDFGRKAPPGPGERLTLLVWVTRPGRR